MIRDAHVSATSEDVVASLRGLRGASAGSADGGVADRFCAWAGQGPRRLVFTVLALTDVSDMSALCFDTPGIALGVRREADGHRRVLWAVGTGPGLSTAGLRAGAEALAGDGQGELHLLPLPTAADSAERGAALEELGFPRLAPAAAGSAPRGRAYAAGARSSAATIQARSGSSRPRSSMCA